MPPSHPSACYILYPFNPSAQVLLQSWKLTRALGNVSVFLCLSLFFPLSFSFFRTTSAAFIESGIYASTGRICPCEYEESSGPNDVFSHTGGTLLTSVLPSGGSLLCLLDEKTQLRQFLEIFCSVQGKVPQKPNPKQSPKLSIWNRCLQSYKQNKIAFCRP